MKILDEALRLAGLGIPVFPCAPNMKTPLSSRGFYDATTDEVKIRDWWKWQPNANLAVPTGHPGYDVLDVDVRKNGSGEEALGNLTAAGYLTGALRVVRTPSGGTHIYFPGSKQGNGSLPKFHLDFRGKGGYVLVPPSHVITDSYEGDYVELQTMTPLDPEWLEWEKCKRFLIPPPKVRKEIPSDMPSTIDGLVHFVAKQTEGNRNNGLYWAVRRAAEQNLSGISKLEDEALRTGLDEVAVRKTMASAMKGITR